MELFQGELERLRLQKGDLLVVEGNGSKTEIGRSALWHGEIENCVHQNHIIRVRLLAGEPKFIDYYWNSSEGNGRVTGAAASTSGLYTLSIRKVSSLPVPIAPAREQRRIVAKIEELFSDLDAGVSALERVKANLKRYRAAVLQAAVTGKLTEAWRARHADAEPASEVIKSLLTECRRKWEKEQLAEYAGGGKARTKGWRAKYTEPPGPDISTLPDLPERWCWASLGALLSEPLRNGHSARASGDGTGIRTLTLTAVTVGDFSEKNTKLTVAKPEDVEDLWLQPGDFLIERSNTPELVGTSRCFVESLWGVGRSNPG
jgi:type I restriction enzyme S subunit